MHESVSFSQEKVSFGVCNSGNLFTSPPLLVWVHSDTNARRPRLRWKYSSCRKTAGGGFEPKPQIPVNKATLIQLIQNTTHRMRTVLLYWVPLSLPVSSLSADPCTPFWMKLTHALFPDSSTTTLLQMYLFPSNKTPNLHLSQIWITTLTLLLLSKLM